MIVFLCIAGVVLAIVGIFLLLWALSLNAQLDSVEAKEQYYRKENTRLRQAYEAEIVRSSRIYKEAADAEKRLTEENRELRKALKQKELALSQKWADSR